MYYAVYSIPNFGLGSAAVVKRGDSQEMVLTLETWPTVCIISSYSTAQQHSTATIHNLLKTETWSAFTFLTEVYLQPLWLATGPPRLTLVTQKSLRSTNRCTSFHMQSWIKIALLNIWKRSLVAQLRMRTLFAMAYAQMLISLVSLRYKYSNPFMYLTVILYKYRHWGALRLLCFEYNARYEIERAS